MTSSNTRSASQPNPTVTGRIVAVEYAHTTSMGNTAKRVALQDSRGEVRFYITAGNASLGYAIGNAEFREHPHTFELNGRGRLVRATPTEGTPDARRTPEQIAASILERPRYLHMTADDLGYSAEEIIIEAVKEARA